MAIEEVVGEEIRSADELLLTDEADQRFSEYTNIANERGQELDELSCSSFSESVAHDDIYYDCYDADDEEEEDDDDDDSDDDDEHTSLIYDESSIEDEAQRLLKEIKIAIKQVRESKFYANLTEQIKGDAFQSKLKQVLGSDYSQLNMVIYALGGLEFGFIPHHQLAIALLLKQDFSCWIGGIEVYDPVFSPADVIVLKELGCEVLLVNERCRRQIEKPTLFYMPYAERSHVGNILGANWCPSRINQLILLSNSFKSSHGGMEKISKIEFFHGCSVDYIYAIQDHTEEILIEEGYGGMYDNIFYKFAFHFFEVDSELDMETLIPDENGKLSKKRLWRQREEDMGRPSDFLWVHKCSEELFKRPFTKDAPKDGWTYFNRAYRGPRRYRCSWIPPPAGWIKLNFGGIITCNSNKGDNNLAGFGGICHNESEEPILIYKGALGKMDQTSACVEALRFGLTELLKIPNIPRNLIVEGDDLRVIQWANKCPHDRPKELHESLNRILELLKEFNSVSYHIYEEANLVANNLAKKGAISGSHVYLLGQYSEDLEDVDNLMECLKLVD